MRQLPLGGCGLRPLMPGLSHYLKGLAFFAWVERPLSLLRQLPPGGCGLRPLMPGLLHCLKGNGPWYAQVSGYLRSEVCGKLLRGLLSLIVKV